jgi:isochorismate hydrolase
MAEVALPGGRVASYQVIGSGRPALMFAGGPGFAAYMTSDADLLSGTLQAYLMDPHGSAFTGSDLEVVLRAGGIDSLVLAGIATSGVVLSTLRQAADLDYRLTVLADGCLDADPEVHRVLLEKVFPRQADVVRIADWTASLATTGAGRY